MSLNKKSGFSKELSIIIINYNLAKEIENCINSLLATFANAGGLSYEVIIVDNNSPDKQLPQIEKKFPQDFIKFIYSKKNLGFGKGCNLGFSNSKGRFICFLNPDTIIQEDIFSPLIRILEQDSSVGIIAPKQQVKKPFFDFSAGYSPKIIFEIFNVFGLGVFVEGLLMQIIGKGSKLVDVNWILGAFILIKADLFDEIGGFDKDYFMFFEEVDLCRKVMNKGFRILYAPQYKIHHIGSVSGKKNYRLYTIRTYSSKYIYITKNIKPYLRYIYRSLLYIQLVSQIIIWLILFPLNHQKSRQKLSAFIFLIRNNYKYNAETQD